MTLEAPPADWYPTWKCRLIVRLEEFGESGTLRSHVPPKPSKNLKGVKDERAPLEVVPDPEIPGRFLLQPAKGNTGASGSGNTVAPDTSSDGLTHVINGVIPKTFEWRQNGFRTADELKVQIRWTDLPIDPRCIRSCAIEFYLGCITPTEYAQGVRGITRGDVYGAGVAGAAEPLNIVPDSYVDVNGVKRSNLRFGGWIVKWKMVWNDDMPSIDLECQDNTFLFMNQLAPPRLTIGGKDPLDKAIATYLTNFPQFAGITVEYRSAPNTNEIGGALDEAPKLETTLAKTAFQPELGPPTGKGGGGDDLVVWDYITDVCGAVGLICRLDGNAIILQRPSTVLNGVAQTRTDDTYKGRTLPSGQYPSRAFIYGRNVLSLEFARDFGKGEVKNIEVRCYSARRKKVLVSRYPDKAARIPHSTPGDARADDKWTIIRVTGVEDEKVLQQIAEDVYNGRNRNEIEAVVKTKNFASFGGGNDDPDILDMKAGDPVEILINRDQAGGSTLGETEHAMTARGANEQLLRDLGFPADFAGAYAKCYQNAGFQRIYRVKEMVANGDIDEGVAFEIRSANFIQARGELAAKTT